MTTSHIPVMTAEVLGFLQPERGGVFVDCTIGLGGHARAMLDAGIRVALSSDAPTSRVDPLQVAAGALMIPLFASRVGRSEF